jgi:hypothetical protein
MPFLLDQKGPKNQGPIEICLFVRPLAGAAFEIPEKNIFFRNFFICSEAANFKMVVLRIGHGAWRIAILIN